MYSPEELSDEAARFAGLLIYNKQALADHQNYWQWRRERSEARWQQQERGELDFDAKNMMHAVRLLLSGRSNELQRIEREFGVRTLLARLSLFAVPKKSKQLIVKVTSSKGLHYATHVSRGIDCACLAVILGGGCAGNFQPSRSRIIRCSVSGCV